MRVWSFSRISAAVLIAATLAACGQGRQVLGDSQGVLALEDIKSVISSTTGYSKDAIELLVSPVHLRVSISDEKLAHSNQMDRENAANTIVTAAEQGLTAHPQLSTVQVISVAIVHAVPKDGSDSAHTEDVLEFRKEPNRSGFSHHIT